jgi:GGDEF domain-containing protein
MESAPLRIGLHRVRLRASIGAAPYDGGSDPEAVIAAADRAMYRRKRAERGDGLALVPAPTAA